MLLKTVIFAILALAMGFKKLKFMVYSLERCFKIIKNRTVAILLLGVSVSGFGQQTRSVSVVKKDESKAIHSGYHDDVLYLNGIKAHAIKDLELPKITKDGQFIRHAGYSLLYAEEYEQARWVAYELTDAETENVYKRTNKFVPDPMVSTGSATNADYKRSGFDRGHLAPAADMEWSATTTAESFYYSNMSPQTPGFNRGIWKQLEEQVRDWATDYGAIYVVTGPVLTKGLPTIGPDEVAVPQYYYKVILEYNAGGVKGIGFVLANEGSKEPLQTFAVSIDEVEKLTGIDFYPLLDDEQEAVIERTVCLSCWRFK